MICFYKFKSSHPTVQLARLESPGNLFCSYYNYLVSTVFHHLALYLLVKDNPNVSLLPRVAKPDFLLLQLEVPHKK